MILLSEEIFMIFDYCIHNRRYIEGIWIQKCALALNFANAFKIENENTCNCWFVRGRIQEKISTIYAIKYQVYCMENTVQWSANTVQLF